ncbi:hypothetical protein SASPL_109066 [Salvia splendens]|uniref:Strictosidine synthase conserved region domain-containing protein n=1 Tax=Salvia splendens TaxID=180675 RepID=A0A8X9A822_SALSN|nr:hypothetical protein SASPL_109066 [Salvia splendens]
MPKLTMNSKLILAAVALPLIAVAVAIALFTPPLLPGSHDVLSAAQRIHIPGAVGPESLVFDPTGGGPYTGVADGRLHVVGQAGGLATSVVTEVEGQRLRFTNDLDIDDENDVIYFTDSSAEYYRSYVLLQSLTFQSSTDSGSVCDLREFMSSVLNLDATGKFMKYDMSSKEVPVLLRGLAFANGVALSKDLSFVLVAETARCRVLRLWLQGPNAGKQDVFAEVPGYPDNIRTNSEGEFWVALHSKNGLIAKLSTSYSWFGRGLWKLPLSFKQLHYLIVGGKPHATAIKLSDTGEVLQVLEDAEGKTLKFISEMEERDGKLWIASVLMPYIGIYNLP